MGECVAQWLLVLLYVELCFSLEFINFVPTVDVDRSPVIYMTNSKVSAFLDATYPSSRTVYFVQRHPQVTHIVAFSCKVNRQNVSLSSIQLCCRKSYVDAVTCETVELDRDAGHVYCGTKLSYTSNSRSGAKFTIRIPDDQKLPVSTLLSCTVTSGGGHRTTVTSNEVEFRDAMFYVNQIPIDEGSSSHTRVVAPLKRDRFPYAFECSKFNNSRQWPAWIDELSSKFGPYEWGFCSVDKTEQNPITCLQERRLFSSSSSSIATSFFNGTLYLLDPTFIESESRAIYCKRAGHDTVVWTFARRFSESEIPSIKEGLSLDTGSTVPTITKLEPLTSTYVKYTILVNSGPEGFVLKALYRKPPGDVSYAWSKDGAPYLGTVTNYTLTLPKELDDRMRGQYNLFVSSALDSLTFVFDVEVLKPPSLLTPTCLSGLFYVMQGRNYTTRCSFQVNKGTPANTLVGVDDIEAANPESLRNLLQTGAGIINKELAKLLIDFQITSDEHSGSLMTGSLRDVNINIQRLQLGQNFKLTVRLTSNIGNAHTISTLRVVPKPILSTSPSDKNCVWDCDQQPFNLSCSLDPGLVQRWKSDYEIVPSIAWLIQDHWSTDKTLDQRGIGQFVAVNPNDTIDVLASRLTVWPQGRPKANDGGTTDGPPPLKTSDQSLKHFITTNLGGKASKHLIIRCWVQLLVQTRLAAFDSPNGQAGPPLVVVQTNQHRAKRGNPAAAVGGPLDRPIYDSRWETDQTLQIQLVATRFFTPDKKAATANLTWIIPVVVGCIIVLIVVSLSLWLCTRKRGQIYMLYNKEREHGNDPIQEMKDKEAFQTYQRQEEYPIASSRYSLNNGSMHVESEDDGELDQYEDGFNEDGSFIHEYKGDPTTVKSPLLPPVSPPSKLSPGNGFGSATRNPTPLQRTVSQTPV